MDEPLHNDRPSTAANAPRRQLNATSRMLQAHAARPPLPFGSAKPCSARADTRVSAADDAVHRDADEVVDVFGRYCGLLQLDVEQVLREYVNARIAEKNASLAVGGYEPRVDGGGWRSHGGIEGLPKEFRERIEVLERARQQFSPQMRTAVDALTDAIESPRTPCPFETFVGRWVFPRIMLETTKNETVVATLNWMANQIVVIDKMVRKSITASK